MVIKNLFKLFLKVIADNLTLTEILEKLYFDEYLYNDLKEYVMPALKNVLSID